ncbi:hypothetical protein E3J74_07115 [Candidatus Bathyarchaeota archaeon]|nr:MAG: hypothetical protein E3J74_07115 [Candidatus Bathyarchaeota archaeon]
MLFRYIALLDNFDSDVDELDLGYENRTLKIRKIPRKEIEEFLSRIKSFDPLWFETALLLGEKMYWMDYHYEVDDSREAMVAVSNAVIEEKEKIVLALRLFKGGSLRTVSDAKKGKYVGLVITPFKGLGGIKRTYFLSGSKAAMLRDFLEEFSHIAWKAKKSKTSLGIALGRFTDGYERLKPEDKMIDYVIGLEALYLHGEGMGEFGYKMAHRASVLLADDKKERIPLFQKIKEAYKLRSKIVHGGKYALSTEDVWLIEDVLRDSIKKFLKTPKLDWVNLIF